MLSDDLVFMNNILIDYVSYVTCRVEDKNLLHNRDIGLNILIFKYQ